MTISNKLKIQEAMLLKEEASIIYNRKNKRKRKNIAYPDIISKDY